MTRKTLRWLSAVAAEPGTASAVSVAVSGFPARSVPDSASVVGRFVTCTLWTASDGACSASPAKLAVTTYVPGLREALRDTVASPLPFVASGTPAAPNPIRTSFPLTGSPPEASRAVTVKLEPKATELGGAVVKVIAVGSGAPAPGSCWPGIDPGW